jgi:hypothetical protein
MDTTQSWEGREKNLNLSSSPDSKYTAGFHSRHQPHSTALFRKPVHLTWSNHILRGREGIQSPR